MQRADKRKFHYIYKIIRDDGRFYIGMHSTDDLEDGYFGSGKKITRSIKKHGLERHSKEILEQLSSRQEAKDREKQLITDELRADPMCMNIAPGGGGGFINEEHQQKFVSSSRTAGLRGTQKAKDIALKALATRSALGTAQFHRCDWNGRTHRDETKQKQSASMLGRYCGENNPQFGTIWVTDGSKAAKIKLEQFEDYKILGYARGRKLRLV